MIDLDDLGARTAELAAEADRMRERVAVAVNPIPTWTEALLLQAVDAGVRAFLAERKLRQIAEYDGSVAGAFGYSYPDGCKAERDDLVREALAIIRGRDE